MDSGEETVWQNVASLLEGPMETNASKSQPNKTEGTGHKQVTTTSYWITPGRVFQVKHQF